MLQGETTSISPDRLSHRSPIIAHLFRCSCKSNMARITIQISAMIVKKPELTKIVYTLLHKMLSVIPLTIILEVNKVEHPATTKTKIEMIVNVLYFITILVLFSCKYCLLLSCGYGFLNMLRDWGLLHLSIFGTAMSYSG